MKRLLCALLCAALLLPLAGCGSAQLNSFTWFVDTIPANLDPQIAQDSADVIACTNLYSGLFRLDDKNALQNDACDSYTLSGDGLTYTFRLKDGLSYRKAKGTDSGGRITAADYVFAFRRIFDAQTASPYASLFAGIQNGTAVLAGTADPSALGVSAADDQTLTITLTAPDENFLQKLAQPCASPCNEAFFNSTSGTYGLSAASVLSSGSFYLYNWTESGLFLRRNSTGTAINNLRFVQNTETSSLSNADLVKNEKCSAILDSGADDTSLTSIPYTDTTWCLVFQCGSVFSNTALRQALAADAAAVAQPESTVLYSAAHGLLPDGLTVDGYSYRTQAGDVLPAAAGGQSAYEQALSQVSADDLKGLSLLVPQSADAAYIEALNGKWQKDYSLFFNIETVDDETFSQRLQDGKFAFALAPLTLTQQDPVPFLSQFDSGWSQYSSASLHQQLAQAQTSAGKEKIQLLAQAERTLVTDSAVVPLYAQNRRLLLDTRITGLRFDPYGPVLDLTYASMSGS